MNMKYGRLFRGDVEYAPDSLEEKDGTVVSNPSAATYLAAGWKRIVDEPPAQEPGCTVCPRGRDEGAGAITKWLFPRERRIERAPNVRNIEQYIERVDEMASRKRALIQS